MSSLNLEDLLANEVGEDLLAMPRGEFTDPCQDNKWYKIKLLEHTVELSKYGQVQLKLVTQVNNKQAIRWLPLPVITDSQRSSVDAAVLAESKKKNAKKLHSFLKIVDPETYKTVTKEKVGDKWFFYDAERNQISSAEAAVFDAQAGKALLEAIKLLDSGRLSYVNTELYYVRVKGDKPSSTGKAKYFDNFYSEAPSSKYEQGT